MFFHNVYPTRPSNTMTKYTIFPLSIGGKIIQMVLDLILLLFPMASKTWLKNALRTLLGGGYSKNPQNLITYIF